MALGEHGASAGSEGKRAGIVLGAHVYLAGRGEARAGDWPMIRLSPRLTRILTLAKKTAAIRGGCLYSFLSFFFWGKGELENILERRLPILRESLAFIKNVLQF